MTYSRKTYLAFMTMFFLYAFINVISSECNFQFIRIRQAFHSKEKKFHSNEMVRAFE